MLIGSKKFSEGWNGWRVSTIGLMNVGRCEGTEIFQVSKLLGHSDVKTTQIYTNLVIDDLHNSVKVLDN